jgi:precorrin-3B synthase
MAEFDIKGWCPGALRPMASGDGLVLRIRAWNGRLMPDQARGIADLSRRHGNGLIDLTSRANLQLRGLDSAGHAAAIAALADMGLLDSDPAAESRRNVILSPFTPVGGPAWQVAQGIAGAMTRPDAPQTPGKFGFAVDAGPALLSKVPADIRLRPEGAGWLILPDGGDWGLGAPDPDSAAKAAVALARWFAQGGIRDGRGRMRDYLRQRPDLPDGAVPVTADPTVPQPGPGPAPNGWMLGFAFGQITPEQLAACADAGPLRLTPWRALLIEGAASPPPVPDAILDPENPLLRIHACTGAPRCPQARADVRALARALASRLAPGHSLHLSGCAKGCAHQGRADLTLIAQAPDRFDLIRDGDIHAAPTRTGLRAADIPL